MITLKRKFELKRWSILWSWFISHSLILLIPILIGLFVYVQVRQLVETEINRANAALLQQVKQVLDGQIESVNRMSVQTAFLPQVRGLLYADQPLTEEDRYSIILALKEFKGLTMAHEMVTDSYVYYKRGDFLLSESALYDPDDYFQMHHKTNENTKKIGMRCLTNNIWGIGSCTHIRPIRVKLNKLFFICDPFRLKTEESH